MSFARVIFLDIDGVLAHFGSHEQLDPECIAELDWLVEWTEAGVILTSSWRDSFGIAETRRRLAAAGFRGRIDDAVPRLPERTRSDEIDAYLASQERRPRFVILDDVPLNEHLVGNLVLVDDFVGLTAIDVAMASRILKCPGGKR
jgi:hypothetical protein